MAESQRILAAIVFTDVVGYSIRIQHEEEKTIALVKRDLTVFSSLCTQHGGKVIKNTGDGLLMFFTSLDAAVKTATTMLQSLEDAAKTLPPDQRLEHRIGIHLGDVMFQGDDVMGEGVNIAARLMAEALPDTLCISQSGFDIIKSRTTLYATFIGPRQLKNIKDPVPAVLLHTNQTLPNPAAGADTAQQDASSQPQTPTGRKPASRLELASIIFFPIILLAGLCIYFFLSRPSSKPGTTPPPTPPTPQIKAPPAPKLRLDPQKPLAKANLFDLIDPARDTVLGEWKWSPAGDLTVAMADPNGENTPPESLARIAIPVPASELPAEYDLTLSFTRHSGSKPVALIFTHPAGTGPQAALELGAWTRDNDNYKSWIWVNSISNRSLPDSPSRSGLTLETSRRYTAVLRVRKDKLIVTLDGSEIFRTQLDPANLSNPTWTLPASNGVSPSLGIGSCRGAVTFHSLEIQAASPEAP
jgi:class 3 adenylate cyclase